LRETDVGPAHRNRPLGARSRRGKAAQCQPPCRGQGRLVETSLEAFRAEAGAFDKAFAINVNVFWVAPDRALPTIVRLLAPGGRLFLFFEPPSIEQRGKAARLCASGLERHGFAIDALVEQDLAGKALLAIIATPSR
jgi:hypothetical protein